MTTCMTVAQELLKKHNEADVLFPSVKSYQQLETVFLLHCRFKYDQTNNHCYQKEETQNIPKKKRQGTLCTIFEPISFAEKCRF